MTISKSDLAFYTPISKREIISEYRNIPSIGEGAQLILRFDDCCKNGYNSFSITLSGKNFGGIMKDEIIETFPEYTDLLKWHLTDTNAPLHYLANTLYIANTCKDLRDARISAVAPTATLEQLQSKEWLENRLPDLMKEFKKDMIKTFNL